MFMAMDSYGIFVIRKCHSGRYRFASAKNLVFTPANGTRLAASAIKQFGSLQRGQVAGAEKTKIKVLASEKVD